MSYEGYYQIICENGHYSCVSESYGEHPITCHECNAEPKWTNAVDETNCYDDGFIFRTDLEPYIKVGTVPPPVDTLYLRNRIVAWDRSPDDGVERPRYERIPVSKDDIARAKQLARYKP